LPEAAEPDRLDRSRWDRQFGIPIELLSIVEKYEIGESLAQIAGRQEADILRQILGEYPNPDLVLHAENSFSQLRIFAERIITLAQNGPFGRLDHEARADEFLDFRLNVEHAAKGSGQP